MGEILHAFEVSCRAKIIRDFAKIIIGNEDFTS